jgi:hypothetical protein
MREGYYQNQKHEWERSRFVAYWVYTMSGKVSDANLSIEEFRPLDEEDLKAVPTVSSKIPEYTPKQKEYLHTLFNPEK